jgi:hypothetical protein
MPELEAGVEFRFSLLRLRLELAARLAAVLGMHWELIFASRIGIDAAPGFTLIVTLGFAAGFATILSPNFEPNFASDVEVVADGDRLGVSSGAELDMALASLAPKLAVTDDAGANAGGRVAVEAAGVAAGMEIASTCIAVPRVRLHSTRQWRGVRRRLGRRAAMVAFSGTCKSATGVDEEGETERKVDAARVARYSPAKSGHSLARSIATMPALQQIGGIEFLLLAA